MTAEKYKVAEDSAPKIADWLAHRGGIAIWSAVDLRIAGRTVTTPLNDAAGERKTAPSWQYGGEPRVITSIDDVEVYVPKVVRTLTVKLQVSGQHPMLSRLELTTGSSNKLRRALQTESERHGMADTYYRFKSTGTATGDLVTGLEFGEDEVEICIDESTVPLKEWLKTLGH